MIIESKFLKPKIIFLFYSTIIFLFYFLFPWIKDKTIYFYRWDEAPYLFIHQQILNTGFIPTSLNYVGGINNYIYPELYLLLNNFLILINDSFNLKLASIALQTILFLSLLISSTITYKITYLLKNNIYTSFLAGLFFIILPIVSGRLFYLHATFYANFVGISFLLLFIYYLYKFNIYSDKKNLLFSVFFYSITLFTHQLVFMMASVILSVDLLINIIEKRLIINEVKTKLLFFLSAIAINIGYILKTPILHKILNVLGITKYEQFGNEMVVKTSTSSLPFILPYIVIGVSIISAIIILIDKQHKNLRIISFFFCFLIISILLNYVNIHLPASFRYDTFFIISTPILTGFFITDILVNNILKTLFILLLFFFFIISVSGITNGFYKEELDSIKEGLNNLKCKNTASYFRIAPWVPVLSESNIYYAHVDIYNAHQDKMEETVKMLIPSENTSLEERISLIKKKKVDCVLYEKNILIKDDIRVKGWEPWRYQDLYSISSKYFEDKNVVIFKI